MSSPDTQATQSGGRSMYPSVSSLPLGKYKAIGNTPYMDIQIIPIDATLGYESLTHNVPLTPSTYFDIDSAYPSVEKGTCTSFVLRKCDGVVQNRYITDSLPSVRHHK